jgi:hypothetical protein
VDADRRELIWVRISRIIDWRKHSKEDEWTNYAIVTLNTEYPTWPLNIVKAWKHHTYSGAVSRTRWRKYRREKRGLDYVSRVQKMTFHDRSALVAMRRHHPSQFTQSEYSIVCVYLLIAAAFYCHACSQHIHQLPIASIVWSSELCRISFLYLDNALKHKLNQYVRVQFWNTLDEHRLYPSSSCYHPLFYADKVHEAVITTCSFWSACNESGSIVKRHLLNPTHVIKSALFSSVLASSGTGHSARICMMLPRLDNVQGPGRVLRI